MTVNISVCIPAYNRSGVLSALLDSIAAQDYDDYEIVICEDLSPERQAIAAIANGFAASNRARVRYFENEQNLGYDRNLRRLLDVAEGTYCLYMGNDDLLAPGALRCIASAIARHDDIGVVLRSYSSFDDHPDNLTQTFRYFPTERFFPAGADSIGTVFRRSVVISGMTFHRALARELATDQFDGSLLYQLYLVARILSRKNGVFVPQIISFYRNGGIPDFGNAESERGKFVPRQHTPESSLHFMREMLRIAEYVQRVDNVAIKDPILLDIANYSYPVLSIQADKPLGTFLRYIRDLQRLGFGRSPLFHLYCLSLLLLGDRRSNAIIGFIKRRLGYTPRIGGIYDGRSA